MDKRIKIKSTFAILDVKNGRKALEAHFRTRPCLGKCPEALRIPVTIKGYLDGVQSSDDGISQEFNVVVESLKAHTGKGE